MSSEARGLTHRTVSMTLADVVVPRPGGGAVAIARNLALVAGGAALVAAAAQLSVHMPWTPVPYTGQTAAVLLVGTALGAPLGAASMALYVLAGFVGLPVYADGAGGAGKLLGLTGGYLLGFVIAAALVGWLAQRRWDRSPLRAAALMAIGNIVIYLVGIPVLAVVAHLPAAVAVEKGALVFVPWDLFKVALAGLLLPAAWRLVGNRGDGSRRS